MFDATRGEMVKRIAILGAGISGLSLAWYLKRFAKEPVQVTVIEKQKRAGGWIQTQDKDGFLFELGPHSLRPKGSGTETLKLIQELGLSKEILPAAPAAHKRYIYFKNRLHAMPQCFFSFAKSPWIWPVFSKILKEPWIQKTDLEDESLDAFIRRRFGERAADFLIDPLVSGIWAGDAKKLSIRSCFPKLWHFEKETGSVIGGAFRSKKKKEEDPWIQEVQKQGLFTFKNGMQTLPDTLAEKLGGDLLLNESVQEIKQHQNRWQIQLSERAISADIVISALPPHALSELLKPLNSKFSTLLDQIPSTSVGIACFGWNQKVLSKKGFGYLIPSAEREKILGVLWDSSAFPEQNRSPTQTRLTVMLGGEHHRELCLEQDNCFDLAKEALSRHLGIDSPPDIALFHKTEGAIPQYNLGHHRFVSEFIESLSALPLPFYAVGNYLNGVSVSDCISFSRELAHKMHR